MGPKGYPACVFFSFIIAVSFLGMGRVALRQLRPARSGASFIENPRQRASGTGIGAEPPALASLTAGLKPRPPGATAPKPPAIRPAKFLPSPVPYLPAADRAATARPASFSLPITFEPVGGAAGQAVRYVGQGKGMTVLLDSGGIGISVGSSTGASAPLGRLEIAIGERRSGSGRHERRDDGRNPTRPTVHRKRRRSATPRANRKPGTSRRRNRQNMPRKDTPGHKGQTPRPQRAPQQRLPRQTKPTASLETPSPNLPGAETNFAWRGLTALSGESNYFLGSDPAKWRTHVPHFAAAEAKDVLPGVDIVAYGNSEGVEYDLRLAPGVDPNDLRLEIANAGAAHSRDLQLDASGDLLVKFAGREMRMKKPAIYEEWAADHISSAAAETN